MATRTDFRAQLLSSAEIFGFRVDSGLSDSGLSVSYEVVIRKRKRNPVIACALPSHRENMTLADLWGVISFRASRAIPSDP